MINIVDVVAEYGSYYLNHGQNQADLLKKLYRPSATAAFFRKISVKDTIKRFGSAYLDRVLQPFQKQFTPTGTLMLKPNKVELFPLKIDKEEYPDDIVDSWVGFLEGDGVDRKQWPFVRWMIEEHIIPKYLEDYELNECYAGIYVAPTPGTAGAAGTAMNGIKKQLIDYGTRVNTIAMGVAPTVDTDFCTYVENFVANQGKEYRKRVDAVFMNEDQHLLYKEGKRKKYNLNYQQAEDLESIYHFPQCKAVGLPSMAGSNLLWSTLSDNRIRLIKKQPPGSPIVESHSPRSVQIFTDWWEVLGFMHPESVYKSDQA